MNFIKLGLITAFFAFFVFACTQINTTTNTNRITQNQNGTTVSYDPVPSNSNANQTAPINDEMVATKKIFSENLQTLLYQVS